MSCRTDSDNVELSPLLSQQTAIELKVVAADVPDAVTDILAHEPRVVGARVTATAACLAHEFRVIAAEVLWSEAILAREFIIVIPVVEMAEISAILSRQIS